MGWLGDLWKKIEGQESVDMMFVRDVGGARAQPDLFVADESYVELYIDSLRLRNVRRFATRFDGVAYSFVTLAFDGTAKTMVPAVSKPDKLAQLDPGGLSNVITVDKQMMGALPWRGGQLLLELGLFSVKGGNLLTPVLDYVTEISNAAGVSFVGKIAPFAPLISKGIDLLAGQTNDVALEIGLDTAIDLKAPGTHAIIAVAKNTTIDPARLSIDPDDRKLLLDGAPLAQAYCVFSVRKTAAKADFGEIPELKEKYADLMTAIKSGEAEKMKAALTAFRLAVIASPDLTTGDGGRLIAKATAKVSAALAGGGVSAAIVDGGVGDETLAAIGLY
jgi:hypothetical protein